MASESSITVRPYQPSDLMACRNLFLRAHNEYKHPDILVDYTFEADMNDIQKYYMEVPDRHWWVAVRTDNNRIVGHVAVSSVQDGDPSYSRQLPAEERKYVCELRRMAVDPDTQRLGVGSKLLSALISFAREKGYRQIHLTTLRSMKKACEFYEKNGFIRGRTEKIPFDLDALQTTEDVKTFFINGPKPIIFEAGESIPDEDQRLMDIPPVQSKYLYAQNYTLAV